MKRTALKIGYIGTNFHGFQRQPNLRTVEEELIYHLRKLDYIDDLKKSRFRIAGRTDAGVHSLGNVISFQSEKEVRVNEINNSLPDDIQILALKSSMSVLKSLRAHIISLISQNDFKKQQQEQLMILKSRKSIWMIITKGNFLISMIHYLRYLLIFMESHFYGIWLGR